MDIVKNLFDSKLPMRGAINRQLLACGIMPSKASLYAHMRQVFTFEESLRIAYVPVLLTKVAFRFAESVCNQCAASKLPYQRFTRLIKSNISSYIESTLGATVSKYTLSILEDRTDRVFRDAGSDVQTLWFVVNQELKKRHPQLDKEYPMLTDLFCAVSLLYYVQQCERAVDIEIQNRTGMPRTTIGVPEVEEVKSALLGIAEKYRICHTSMMHLSVRIISMRIDEIVQGLKEIYKNELEGKNR